MLMRHVIFNLLSGDNSFLLGSAVPKVGEIEIGTGKFMGEYFQNNQL